MDTLVCTNCSQQFLPNNPNRVFTRDETPQGFSAERAFCSPDCSLEWEERGGEGRSAAIR